MSNEQKGLILGFLGVVTFGFTLPVTRFTVVYFDPMFIGLGRAVVASLVAGLLLFVSKTPIPSKKQIGQLFLVALGVVIGFPLLSAWAMRSVPASHGGVILGVLPLATAIIGTWFSHEKPSVTFWLLGICGACLVGIFSVLQGFKEFMWGDLGLFAAALLAGTGYAIGGILSKEIGGWKVICWALVLSLPFILLPAIYYIPDHPNQFSFIVWGSFFYLALVSQLFAFFLWNKGLVLGGVVRTSQLLLLQPFITIIASYFLIGEQIETITIVFALLVVTVVAFNRKTPIH
ncbi:DMT family transporter [Candidatus Nitrosacidococcus sp. I8]|uniref:DMT family transporter n=1 Tax=Candidatus Nitrosacidococcus sp. I8 TaxID=2942908 RepID=UPI002226B409|nr:DMT family transporter [Candidatus Nitrosacidococcus sp. I8]CAH9019793.1 hypothetical protein NURINAE_01747 [Candidatus Nitrosacidococcus sp. I8]